MQESEFKELKWNGIQRNHVTAASDVNKNIFPFSVCITHKHTQYRASAKLINVNTNL